MTTLCAPTLGPLRGDCYATLEGWTDRYPYEILARTAKTITVRPMRYEKDPTWKPEFVPGGFSAVCVNQGEQRWLLSSDEDAVVLKAYLRKGGMYHCALGPLSINRATRFYDYNF